MKRLLLISSSRVHGSGLFEHCQPEIGEHLATAPQLLFIPYALDDYDRYEQAIAEALGPRGVTVRSIHHHENPLAAVEQADAIFIGGGNSFRLLKSLYDHSLLEPIRSAVLSGVPYMGSSAGTNMACPTIRTTNDMPIVQPPSFDTLGLIPFQINPHFIDADPQSKHQGETREQRLQEYFEENQTPVIGLREGSWLTIEGQRCWLGGKTGGKMFERGKSAIEMPLGADISRWM